MENPESCLERRSWRLIILIISGNRQECNKEVTDCGVYFRFNRAWFDFGFAYQWLECEMAWSIGLSMHIQINIDHLNINTATTRAFQSHTDQEYKRGVPFCPSYQTAKWASWLSLSVENDQDHQPNQTEQSAGEIGLKQRRRGLRVELRIGSKLHVCLKDLHNVR